MNYLKEDFTVTKLTLLYLLSNVNLPLSISQITQVIIEKGYTDYFSLRQYLTELENAHFINISKKKNISYYEVTKRGQETLGFFMSRIPDYIKEELDEYISTNWKSIKSELEVTSDYFPVNGNQYLVNIKAVENNIPLIDLKVAVGSKKQAIELCNNWANNAPEIYGQVLHLLYREDNK